MLRDLLADPMLRPAAAIVGVLALVNVSLLTARHGGSLAASWVRRFRDFRWEGQVRKSRATQSDAERLVRLAREIAPAAPGVSARADLGGIASILGTPGYGFSIPAGATITGIAAEATKTSAKKPPSEWKPGDQVRSVRETENATRTHKYKAGEPITIGNHGILWGGIGFVNSDGLHCLSSDFEWVGPKA